MDDAIKIPYSDYVDASSNVAFVVLRMNNSSVRVHLTTPSEVPKAMEAFLSIGQTLAEIDEAGKFSSFLWVKKNLTTPILLFERAMDSYYNGQYGSALTNIVGATNELKEAEAGFGSGLIVAVIMIMMVVGGSMILIPKVVGHLKGESYDEY